MLDFLNFKFDRYSTSVDSEINLHTPAPLGGKGGRGGITLPRPGFGCVNTDHCSALLTFHKITVAFDFVVIFVVILYICCDLCKECFV